MILKALNIYLFVLFISFGFSVDLSQNQSYTHLASIESSGEYLIDIILSSDTSWEEEGNESAILTIFINGIYNQDIVIYNGSDNHHYKQALGYLESEDYEFEFYFNYTKSSIMASTVHIENIEFINTAAIDVDEDVFKYSPILYGRNIFSIIKLL